MKQKEVTHDKLAMRLGIILTKLFSGHRINQKTLAEEFKVTERTIQRDLNQRLMYLPIERHSSDYHLCSEFLKGLVVSNRTNFSHEKK